jgi:hypothetical protein
MKKMMKKAKRYQEGGEAEDKKRGLKASEGEKVGFLERIRMGNIDDPTSEAYKRLGAGRGRSTPAPDMTPYSETEDARNLMRAAARERAEMDTDESGIGRYARETGIGTMRQPAKQMPSPTRAPKPRVDRERSVQPSTQDIDRLEAATTAARMRDERRAYMQDRDAQSAARRAKEMSAPTPTPRKEEGGLKKYAQILEEGKERRAAARAAEPKEEKKPGRRPQRGPKAEVPARPSRAFSTPASRKAWDEKYGDKYEASGKRKEGMKAGGMVGSKASKRADGCAVKGKTRGRII